MNFTSGLSYLLKGGYYNIYEILYTKFFGSCFYFLLTLNEMKRLRKKYKHIFICVLEFHFVSIFGPGGSILSKKFKTLIPYSIYYNEDTFILQ
jgi:hypothetical protein